jgi:hypothetical protein
MSGNYINNLHDPAFGRDATNKNYVDINDSLKVNKSGDFMTGDLLLLV